MTEITKRSLIGAGGLALVAARAAAQGEPAGPTGGPFVTRHSGVFGGRQVDYVATVGELTVPGPGKEPGVGYVCTWYIAQPADPRRPVLFAFNGGPSGPSAPLHMVALGPKRIAIAQDPKAPEPPPGYGDNPDCPLDACDIVFIDPPETGFTRVLPGGHRDVYYSVNGDAQSVADFLVAWCKANGREASPKYVLGESYGTMRAAVMAGDLAKVMPLDGVFLFGQAVNMIETSQRAQNVLAYATNITALSAIAAYHGKARTRLTDAGAIASAAYAWGMGPYLQALLKGYDLPRAERRRIAGDLQDMTGIPAAWYRDHDLKITKIAYARELLRPEGLMLGTYDARYVGPAPQPGQRPVDPAGKLQSAIYPMMARHFTQDLGVTWPMSEYREMAPDTRHWEWNGTLGPGGPFLDYDYPARITEAFRANPKFRLMIGNGYYDLTTTIGPARYMTTLNDWPRERVFQRAYVGGHMAYTHLPSLRAFTSDIRAFVSGRAAA